MIKKEKNEADQKYGFNYPFNSLHFCIDYFYDL